MPSKWQLSANALYQIGKGFEIAGNLYAREGYIRPINLTVGNTFDDTVLAMDIGDQRLPNIWNVDLRLAWNGKHRRDDRRSASPPTSSTCSTPRPCSGGSTPPTPRSFNRIDQILNPLLVRFGMRLTF